MKIITIVYGAVCWNLHDLYPYIWLQDCSVAIKDESPVDGQIMEILFLMIPAFDNDLL